VRCLCWLRSPRGVLQPGRCPPLRASDLRHDGGRVSAIGATGSKALLDGAPFIRRIDAGMCREGRRRH
jgi:hypothetical protein